MYIGDHARERPDHPAVVDTATGETLTYRELDDRSNRLAQLLHADGLRHGATVALFMENNIRFLEVAWAALRSGLYLTAVNRYLTAVEAAYIINDCDARVLISSAAKAEAAAELPARLPRLPTIPDDGRRDPRMGVYTKPPSRRSRRSGWRRSGRAS